ncbi:hypothetical protein SEA_JACKO_106 [Microbacterium phage Jacko]|nr:hypothetical protein SEA_JACKO_106 [Microbacterium phage Jacko]
MREVAERDARQAALKKEREDWYVDHEAEPWIAGNAFLRGWDAAVEGGFRRTEAHAPADSEREAREAAWQEYLSRMLERDAKNNLAGRGLIPSHRDWHAGWDARAAHGSEIPEPSNEEGEREEITDEALWDFAGDLLDAWGIEDTNAPSLAEDFRDRFVARFYPAYRAEPQGEPSDAISIPRPHVPFGPEGVPEHEADADYLDHAAASLEGHYEVGGSNVRATVVKMLRDAAAALRAASAVTTEPLIECPHWSPGKTTLRRGCTACAAVTEQGENR